MTVQSMLSSRTVIVGLGLTLSVKPSCRFLSEPGGISASGPGLTSRVYAGLTPVVFDHSDALARAMLCSLFSVPQLIAMESIEIVKPVSAFQISM